MKIEKIEVGELQTNCYIVSINNDAIIIDPGDEENRIINKCSNYNIKGILITHHHFDHVGALDYLENYYNLKHNPDIIEGFDYEVIKVPGHTSDSIAYYFKKENIMFVGDFIFKSSIGRCDLPTGNYQEMTKSLKMISNYPDDIVLYPGHGDKTTLKEEKRHFNSYY